MPSQPQSFIRPVDELQAYAYLIDALYKITDQLNLIRTELGAIRTAMEQATGKQT